MEKKSNPPEENRWDVIFGVKTTAFSTHLEAISVVSPLLGSGDNYTFSVTCGHWIIAGGDGSLIFFDLPITDYLLHEEDDIYPDPSDKGKYGAYGYFRVEFNLEDLMADKISRITSVQVKELNKFSIRKHTDLADTFKEGNTLLPLKLKNALVDVSEDMRKDTGIIDWLKEPVIKYEYAKDNTGKNGDYIVIAMNRKERTEPVNIFFPFEECAAENNFIYKISSHVLTEHYILNKLSDATELVRRFLPDRFISPFFQFKTEDASSVITHIDRKTEEDIPNCFFYNERNGRITNNFQIALAVDEIQMEGGTVVLYAEIKENDYNLNVRQENLVFDITVNTPMKFRAPTTFDPFRYKSGISIAHYNRVYTYVGQRDEAGKIQISLKCISSNNNHEWAEGIDPVGIFEREMLEFLGIILETPLSFLLSLEWFIILTVLDALFNIELMLDKHYFEADLLEDKFFEMFDIKGFNNVTIQTVHMHDGLSITGVIS